MTLAELLPAVQRTRRQVERVVNSCRQQTIFSPLNRSPATDAHSPRPRVVPLRIFPLAILAILGGQVQIIDTPADPLKGEVWR